MKSFDTKLAAYAKKTRLKAAEREELRERILTYMEYHPLPKEVEALSEQVTTRRFALRALGGMYARVAVGAFAVLLVVIGVPFAAERSVPGDALYLVKTKVNEEVRAQFVDSPYEKIAFETELMERRIAEARLLKKEGRLTEEVEAELAETVKGHATAAWEGIAELNATDAEEGAIAKITFSSAIDVQSAFFGDDENGEKASHGIAGVVNAAKASIASDTSTTTPSYERLSARTEEQTTRAYELFASVKESATDEERKDIERRLSDVEHKIVNAEAEHEVDAKTSIAALSEALADTQKLISFMTNIDVRENVALETLVPVVLTPEERLSELEKMLEDGEGAGSFNTELTEYVSDIRELLEAGNLREAEDLLGEAEAFIATPPESEATEDIEEESDGAQDAPAEEADIDGEVEAAATTTVDVNVDAQI